MPSFLDSRVRPPSGPVLVVRSECSNAVAIRRDGMSDAVLASSPSGVYFISEEAAVEYAMAWAVSWVDRNGAD